MEHMLDFNVSHGILLLLNTRTHLPLPSSELLEFYQMMCNSTYAQFCGSIQGPKQIDKIFKEDLQKMQDHHVTEEQHYVDQMLLNNPIVVERRAVNAPLPDDIRENEEISRILQQQRAESCRKSRYNYKIKKTIVRLRNKYVVNRLKERTKMLNLLRDLIPKAEKQLLSHGYKRKLLEQIRVTFGLEGKMIGAKLPKLEIPAYALSATPPPTPAPSISPALSVDTTSILDY